MSVYFYGCVTLDGYLAGRDHNLDWLHESGSGKERVYEPFYLEMDVSLMGLRSFWEPEKS